MKDKIWYEISSEKIALETTLTQLGLLEKPTEKDEEYGTFIELMKKNRSLARGVKYGVESYSLMYMEEREKILGNWEEFFLSFCLSEQISTVGNIFVGGINDGQEVSFLKGKVLGLDISADAIVRGMEYYSNISFVHDDLILFAIEKESMDTYVLLRTIHFFSNIEKVIIISKAFTFLRNGGRILISVPGGFLDKNGEIIFGQKSADDFVDIEKPMKDASEIAEIMRKAGFLKVRILNHKIEIFLVGEK